MCIQANKATNSLAIVSAFVYCFPPAHSSILCSLFSLRHLTGGLASATGHKRQVQALSATVDRGEAGARLGATGGRSGPGAFDNDMISGQSPYMPEQRTWLVRRARGSAMCCLSRTRPAVTVSA